MNKHDTSVPKQKENMFDKALISAEKKMNELWRLPVEREQETKQKPTTQEADNFLCLDCKDDTLDLGEYYVVEDEVWNETGIAEGMLCIGCLEKRIKRTLKCKDFKKTPLNILPSFRKSNRLLNRMTNGLYLYV